MIVSCTAKNQKPREPRLSSWDPTSYSRPDLAIVTELELDLTANFQKRIFHGIAVLYIKKHYSSVTEVLLDTKDLTIRHIYEVEINKYLKFSVSQPYRYLGSKLTIHLPPKPSNVYICSIRYETSPIASGLHWVPTQLTFGKNEPLLYSNFQPLNARSFLPCQDTPSVKGPYTALIRVPSGLTVLMSSPRRLMKEDDGEFYFKQEEPIPVCLLAIAIGHFGSQEVGKRCKVWAEQHIINEVAAEFSNNEELLEIAEDICGPYNWGIFDILIMPLCYPSGCVEYPCMAFVSSTVITGDKTLAFDMIANAVAHSWAGNMVSPINYEHYWLSEGISKFIQRKIIGYFMDHQALLFHAYCGLYTLKQLSETNADESQLTTLVSTLDYAHYNDIITAFDAEKGSIFMCYLEIAVGGAEIFECFLRSFFTTYKHKSIDSETFKSYFQFYFLDFGHRCAIKGIDWDTWLYEPGMPPIIPIFDNRLEEGMRIFKTYWLQWDQEEEEMPFDKTDIKRLQPCQIIQLLEEILNEPQQPIEKLIAMEKVFKFDSTKNCEIKYRWLMLALKSRWKEKVPVIFDWINYSHRLHFVVPFYKSMFETKYHVFRAVQNIKKNARYMIKPVVAVIHRALKIVDEDNVLPIADVALEKRLDCTDSKCVLF